KSVLYRGDRLRFILCVVLITSPPSSFLFPYTTLFRSRRSCPAFAARGPRTVRGTRPIPARLAVMTDAADAPAESAHTTGLRKAVLFGALALIVLAVVSVGVWAAVDRLPGVWGALMGAAVGGAFVLTTAIVTIATARSAPQTAAAVLLGTWLLKLVVVIGVVAALRPLEFYSKPAFAVTIVVAMVV